MSNLSYLVSPNKIAVAMGTPMITLASLKTSAPRFALKGSVQWVQAIALTVLILSATLTVGGRRVARITLVEHLVLRSSLLVTLGDVSVGLAPPISVMMISFANSITAAAVLVLNIALLQALVLLPDLPHPAL